MPIRTKKPDEEPEPDPGVLERVRSHLPFKPEPEPEPEPERPVINFNLLEAPPEEPAKPEKKGPQPPDRGNSLYPVSAPPKSVEDLVLSHRDQVAGALRGPMSNLDDWRVVKWHITQEERLALAWIHEEDLAEKRTALLQEMRAKKDYCGPGREYLDYLFGLNVRLQHEHGRGYRSSDVHFRPWDSEAMRFTTRSSAALVEKPEEIGVLQIARTFADRVQRQRDTFFVVDISMEAAEQFGGGKTHILIQLLQAASFYIPSVFDLRHDMTFGDDHARLRRHLQNHEQGACRGVDELDQFAYKRDTNKGANKATIAVWKRNRKWGQLWGGCTPSIWELDPFLRDIKITHRIRIKEWDDNRRRGYAELFTKGGYQDPEKDRWGRFNMGFDYGPISSPAYLAYKEIVTFVEDHYSTPTESSLDKFLRDNPDWLKDEIESVLSLDVALATVLSPLRSSPPSGSPVKSRVDASARISPQIPPNLDAFLDDSDPEDGAELEK